MGRFILRRGNGGIVFCLKARNGEVIGTSEQYRDKNAAMEGIEAVITNCSHASIEDRTVNVIREQPFPKFIVLQEKNYFYFNLLTNAGQKILCSQRYTAKASCINGIKSVVDNAPGAEVDG